MHYEIVELKEAQVAGFTVRTNNASPDMGTVISGLWQRFLVKAAMLQYLTKPQVKLWVSTPIMKMTNTAITRL